MKFSLFVRFAIVLVMLLSLGLVPVAGQDCDGEVINLEFMNWWGAAREPLMIELIGHFQAENPCVTVENQVQPWDNRAEIARHRRRQQQPAGHHHDHSSRDLSVRHAGFDHPD